MAPNKNTATISDGKDVSTLVGTRTVPRDEELHAAVAGKNKAIDDEDADPKRVSNEYVLNVAFVSFLGFTAVQFGYSIKAKSQAMMTDSEAMAVDALTYLFNLFAEHFKNQPYSEKELKMPHSVRHRRRKLKRLYLELIPPGISVTTLIVVTVMALRDAFETLLHTAAQQEDQPDLNIMLFFSGLNLVLDLVNVTCFARADQAVGLPINYQEVHDHVEVVRRSSVTSTTAEKTVLLALDKDASKSNSGGLEMQHAIYDATVEHHHEDEERSFNTAAEEHSEAESESTKGDFEGLIHLNLNMCSAWTHVCADTLRSVAVLIAAGIAAVVDSVTAEEADATAAVIVSFIIIFSLGPLFQGLYLTALEIHTLKAEELAASQHEGLTISV